MGRAQIGRKTSKEQSLQKKLAEALIEENRINDSTAAKPTKKFQRSSIKGQKGKRESFKMNESSRRLFEFVGDDDLDDEKPAFIKYSKYI